MGLVSKLLSFITGRPAGRRRSYRGAYDNAQTTTENHNHWAWVDSLNANAANSPEVRRTLRERARYEADNNGYCGGLIDKLGNDLVGTCPRVQLTIPGVPRAAGRAIEKAFSRWARAVGLGAKLRLMDNMAVRDGEGFGLLVTNRALPPELPQLDLRLYETDQVDTPFLDWADPLAFPGGRLDEHGNVVEWHFLKAHPGSDVWLAASLDFDVIPAGRVVQWFKPRRAGQVRGVPEVQSSLSLYAVLRRYTLAELGKNETAASIAGVLESDVPPDDGDAPTFDTMDEVDIPRRGLLTLPGGWKAKGFDYTQSASSYREFKGEILTEAGTPVGAPRNVSTNSSAEYNYSSGRLDHGIYQRGVRVRRHDLAVRVLDRVFRAWLDEAALIPGLIPDGLPVRALWSWEWQFDGFSSLDPEKDAKTDDLRLANGTTTYAEVYAERGLDWEEAFEQQARERQRRQELGLTPARPAPAPAAPPTEEAADAEPVPA